MGTVLPAVKVIAGQSSSGRAHQEKHGLTRGERGSATMAACAARVRRDTHGDGSEVPRSLFVEVEEVAVSGRTPWHDQVTVTMEGHGSEVVIVVSDDGVGFEQGRLRAALAGGHFGVRGMSERMHGVGGEVVVRSDVGRGTTVRIVIPQPSGKTALSGTSSDEEGLT